MIEVPRPPGLIINGSPLGAGKVLTVSELIAPLQKAHGAELDLAGGKEIIKGVD